MIHSSLRWAAIIFPVLLLALMQPASAADVYKIYFGRQMSTPPFMVEDTIDAAVQDAVGRHATQITIVGHADTGEKKGAKLSLARVKEIKKLLLARHLPKSVRIVMKAVGTKDLAVQTGPNVFEPLNRSVEILMH